MEPPASNPMAAGALPSSPDRGDAVKIILSRKGFDSENGGTASPILPDGRMVSLPIPAHSNPKAYAEITWNGGNLGGLVQQLTKGLVAPTRRAHLDPDLDPGALPRQEGWCGAFGQVGSPQGHLRKEGVCAGDLFLFFGWFREVDQASSGDWRFRRGARDVHVLFGWLQVAEVLRGDDIRRHAWLADHPHANGTWADSNTIYVASERLVIDGEDLGVPGAGTFGRYHPARQLTKVGNSRTVWQLPAWFLPDSGPTLSCHRDPTRWTRNERGCVLRTIAKGQEFVLDVTPMMADFKAWLAEQILAGVRP